MSWGAIVWVRADSTDLCALQVLFTLSQDLTKAVRSNLFCNKRENAFYKLVAATKHKVSFFLDLALPQTQFVHQNLLANVFALLLRFCVRVDHPFYFFSFFFEFLLQKHFE